MSKSVKLVQTNWTTVKDHTVVVASKMSEDGNHKTFNSKFANCVIPSKSFISRLLAVCEEVKKNMVKKNDKTKKYQLTDTSWELFQQAISKNMDIPTNDYLRAKLDRFVNRHIGRFHSKHGTADYNVVDFIEGIIHLVNAYRERQSRVGTTEYQPKKSPSKKHSAVLNRILK